MRVSDLHFGIANLQSMKFTHGQLPSGISDYAITKDGRIFAAGFKYVSQ